MVTFPEDLKEECCLITVIGQGRVEARILSTGIRRRLDAMEKNPERQLRRRFSLPSS
jgi:hypothetical protein